MNWLVILLKSGKLKPINASKKYYLNTTDEYPILFIISAFIKVNLLFQDFCLKIKVE